MKKPSVYEDQNLRAAEIILQRLERYGGSESLMARWARAVIKRAAQQERTESLPVNEDAA